MNREQLEEIRKRADWFEANKPGASGGAVNGYGWAAAAIGSAQDVPALLDEIERLNQKIKSFEEFGSAEALRAVVDVVLDVLPIDPDSGMAIVGWTGSVDSSSTAKWGAPEILAERVVKALVGAGLIPVPAPVADPLAEFGRRRAAELNARGADVCPVCLAPRDAGICRWCPTTAEGSAEGGNPKDSSTDVDELAERVAAEYLADVPTDGGAHP